MHEGDFMHGRRAAASNGRQSKRHQYFATASFAAAFLAIQVAAPGVARAAEAAADVSDLSEVVVTASRVDRAGFTAPTPTTTVGLQELQKAGTTNVADYLNTVPAFGAGTTPASTAHNSVNSSLNLVNLRSLGANRTLVLVDRKRFTPSSATGRVDLNVIPTVMIERVEVVTGGASAAWGSDAVAGVVNLIFKKNLDGLSGEVSGGLSQQGDNQDVRVALSWGGTALDGRLHLSVASEYEDNKGVGPDSGRAVLKQNIQVIPNPNYKLGNGQPQNYLTSNVNVSTATLGGVVTTGPFAGQQFTPGGALVPFTYGTMRGNAFMIGGSGISLTNAINQEQLGQLVNPLRRGNIYLRSTYDVTDNLEATFEASYAQSFSQAYLSIPYDLGTITIQRDNAYLTAGQRATLTAANVSSFKMGRINKDISYNFPVNETQTHRFMFGLNGKFDAFGSTWKWDGYVATGSTRYQQKIQGNRIIANWNQAIDAVVNPANGQIVCRSTLTKPTNGCVPINLFGQGSPSAAASRYVTGTSMLAADFKQDAAAVNISGEPFSVPAGPVSLAAGLEYRKESVSQVADAISNANGFNIGNPHDISGSETVKEAFAETVVPLLKDIPLVKALDFNGAVRITDYKTSGAVTTWKAGLSWAVTDDVRLRAARSRDIRAPALGELYASYILSKGTLTDPAKNNQQFQVDTPQQGNPNLKPETADTITFGVVYQPSFISGLSISVDYYNIDLKNAIGALGSQDIINRCYQGVTDLCRYVERNAAGEITRVTRANVNLSELKTAGVDFEVAYNTPLSRFHEGLPGDLGLRFLGTYTDYLTSVDNNIVQQLVSDIGFGHNGIPQWKWSASATWRDGPLTLYSQLRYTEGGRDDNTKDAAGAYVTQVLGGKNWFDGQYITDLSIQYELERNEGRNVTLFASVKNLFDTYGPPVGIGYILPGPTNFSFYDSIGRQYQVGVRFHY
jgi:outer membrane receptor protein involved in Fe transport